MNRRDFVKSAGSMAALATFPVQSGERVLKPIKIVNTNANFERQPLIRPFGFKGGSMTEIWQTVALLESENGVQKTGICTHNVLWSDAKVFASHSESAGNALMFATAERALQIIKGQTFTHPVQLLDSILDEVYAYAKTITRNPNLRKTFVLNALVGVDNAVWLLFAQENNIKSFDELIPAAYKPGLSHHHERVASIPSMAYTIPVQEMKDAVKEGYFLMKIKLGQSGTQSEMLEKDKARLTAIQQAIGDARTSYAANGKLPYYLDMNGRYEQKDTLSRLLDHARKIGAFDQIILVEEPFPEELEVAVGDFGVRVAADESAHSDADVRKRIQMGYEAIALKAIAKTLSMTMKMAQAAHELKTPALCADLTVNPNLLEWNKNVAARLAPFPGFGMGLMENNGHQNYKNWDTMRTYNATSGASWAKTQRGVFQLNTDYYQKSGGIFEPSAHYEELAGGQGK
ncbi:MAG: L-alanine-DL-glutamate epimerase [Cytophagaceae bacterium]|nr:L-alanine-DL-glutamate epimerase [Cytophagaceae bacterium]